MRRDELEAVLIQLPVLATVVLGALPGPATWAMRLERIGLDVISTGAHVDHAAAISAARSDVPHRPLLARAGDPAALAAAGARIIVMDGIAPWGTYALHRTDAAVVPVVADTPAESANDVARDILSAARRGSASRLWVAAPNMVDVPEAVAEAKLTAMVEGARMARMWLAKQQSDPD
ncbi:MAG: hypothetical protein EXQ74_00390 [Thermoleophilia bacterium]|nr:hypothetical protein [Thermoleophilia bacterium]